MGQCCAKKIPDVEIEIDGNNCCDHLKSKCCTGLTCCIIQVYRAASTRKLPTPSKNTLNADETK